MAEIRVDNVQKRFAGFAAVKGSTFTVPDRGFVVMLGPSGCGKTTTLRMIAGLEMPSAGSILIDGDDVTSRRARERDIAFVFQLFALYPHLDVFSNIAYPLRSQGTARSEVRERVMAAARLLRIEHLLHRRVGGLAGGDRQRVALGRALVRRPKAFLMDEPLGALDAEFRRLMCGELRELHDRIGATTVYVTHDQLEAMALADCIIVMNHGVIEQIGAPQDVYDRPASMFVADFLGSPPMSFIRFRAAVPRGARSVRVNGAALELPEVREPRAEGPLALGVRPEHVSLDDASPLRGRVYGSEYLGTTQIVTVDTAHGQLKARLPASLRVSSGDNVGLKLRAERLVLFDAESGRALASAAGAGGSLG